MIGWAQMILIKSARMIGKIIVLAAIMPAMMMIIEAAIIKFEVVDRFIYEKPENVNSNRIMFIK